MEDSSNLIYSTAFLNRFLILDSPPAELFTVQCSQNKFQPEQLLAQLNFMMIPRYIQEEILGWKIVKKRATMLVWIKIKSHVVI